MLTDETMDAISAELGAGGIKPDSISRESRLNEEYEPRLCSACGEETSGYLCFVCREESLRGIPFDDFDRAWRIAESESASL